MGFNDIKKIEDYQFYLDLALRKAREKVETKGKTRGDRIKKAINDEITRFDIIDAVIKDRLNKIINNFPHVEEVNEFYADLMKITIEVDAYRLSLGSLKWAEKKVSTFKRLAISKIAKSKSIKHIESIRKETIGRISSILKQINKHLKYLEECRLAFRDYPNIKSNMFTVCLTGFPNVGKTTLLSKLTGSKPEISNYAFTTKKINVGHIIDGYKKMQILDTPGTLNRFSTMNNIEKQADLAMKNFGDMVIMVFDPTETSFPVEKQKKLYNKMRIEFSDRLVVFFSKTDIDNKLPNIRPKVSFDNIKELNDHIISEYNKYEKKK